MLEFEPISLRQRQTYLAPDDDNDGIPGSAAGGDVLDEQQQEEVIQNLRDENTSMTRHARIALSGLVALAFILRFLTALPTLFSSSSLWLLSVLALSLLPLSPLSSPLHPLARYPIPYVALLSLYIVLFLLERTRSAPLPLIESPIVLPLVLVGVLGASERWVKHVEEGLVNLEGSRYGYKGV